MGHPCDLAGKSHLNGYWAQSRLWPFPAGRTSRGNPRGTAEFLRGSVRSEAVGRAPDLESYISLKKSSKGNNVLVNKPLLSIQMNEGRYLGPPHDERLDADFRSA